MSEIRERYVATVLNSISEKRRSDVERELRAAIDDAIEARVNESEEPSAAEATVLTDLGDPARLAADYSERPLYLISPRFYLPWLRVMRRLLTVIPPLAGVVVVLVQLLTRDGLVEAILGGLWAGFFAAVNVVVWTTLGFALAGTGRIDHSRRPRASDTVDPVVPRPPPQGSRSAVPPRRGDRFHGGDRCCVHPDSQRPESQPPLH